MDVADDIYEVVYAVNRVASWANMVSAVVEHLDTLRQVAEGGGSHHVEIHVRQELMHGAWEVTAYLDGDLRH